MKDLTLEKLRNQIQREEQLIAKKQRFGLFSQLPSIGLGDDSPYRSSISNKKHQVQDSFKAGRSKSEYFSNIKYIQDLYKDKSRMQIKKQKINFYGGQIKSVISPYKHIQQNQIQNVKNAKKYIDENGKVKTQRKNILTNPISNIQYRLFKYPKYKASFTQQKKPSHLQIPFINRFHVPDYFNPNKHLYHQPQQIKKIIHSKIMIDDIHRHQSPFKLGNKDTQECINKYPEYMQNPENKKNGQQRWKQRQRQWKPKVIPFSKPSPSISLHSIKVKDWQKI